MSAKVIDNSSEFFDKMDEEIKDKLLESILTVEAKAREVCVRQTGTLARSITHEIDFQNGIAQAGTNIEYAPFVELGTKNMAARPFLRVGLLYFKSQFNKIWNRKR